MAATARADSAITGRRDRIVAATVTGARIRIANGFCNPPGQIEQDRELQHVVGEIESRVALAEPGRPLAVYDQHEIEQRRGGDDGERGQDRQAEAEAVMDDQQGQRLPADRDPADRAPACAG